MTNNGSESLATIQQGQVPETRMSRADQVQDYVRRLIDQDDKRSRKRGLVNGLVDGNPPYKAGKLRDAGRAEACNVNWGTGRGYLESGSGAFYDLSSEAPGTVLIRTDWGQDEEQKATFSREMSDIADSIFNASSTPNNDLSDWDYEMQQSQWEMVLHGPGPFLFEDEMDSFPRAFHAADLLLPERTRSSTKYWEAAVILADYYPPQLYNFIRNEKAASTRGWDVAFTKSVIENAMDIRTNEGRLYNWEWYQTELKSNSLAYYEDNKICRLAHVFWKEFDGKITHVIVERESTGTPIQMTQPGKTDESNIKFLFRKIGRYENWNQAIHPMYFDRGNGGYHHTVTGLGVKMYGAMEYENRLLCNLMDKAFAPKTLFKPTTAEGSQRFELALHGDWAKLPAGYDVVQQPIAGLLTDGLAMHKASSEVIRSNLSSYRQQVPAQESGNPPTKFQKQLEASQQSALSKTTYNRYYKQLDALYAEIIRRMCKSASSDSRAKEFQKKCEQRGIPKECLSNIVKVEAVRVIGQGSSFMRRQAIDSLLPIAAALPENGRVALLSDKIAAEAGQAAVPRYHPKPAQELANDQQAEAVQWVAAMKIGVPPVVTATQNPVTYAATFLNAGMQAVQSVQQGADPMDVLKFLEIIGPAIAAHLKRFANDPIRAGVFKQMTEQWKQLAKITDDLKAMVQQQVQKQQKQRGKTGQVMSDIQLKNMEVAADIKRKDMKQQHAMQLQNIKTRQKLALDDASTAAEIERNRLKAFQE